jgi:hypothetical protein
MLPAFFCLWVNAQTTKPYFELGAGTSFPTGSFAHQSVNELKEASTARFLSLGWTCWFTKWAGFSIESSFQKFPSETRFSNSDLFPLVKTEYQVFTFMVAPTIHYGNTRFINFELRPLFGLQSVNIPAMHLPRSSGDLLTRKSISTSVCFGIKAKYGIYVHDPMAIYLFGSYYNSQSSFTITEAYEDLYTLVGFRIKTLHKNISYFSLGVSIAMQFPLKQID